MGYIGVFECLVKLTLTIKSPKGKSSREGRKTNVSLRNTKIIINRDTLI